MLALVFSWSTSFGEDPEDLQRVPVSIFDFAEGPLGWEVKNLESLTKNTIEGDQFYWRSNSYYAGGNTTPGGMWFTGPAGPDGPVRNTMIISPEINLGNMSEVQLLVDFGFAWAQNNNNFMRLYVQAVDSLDLTIEDDSLYIKQWQFRSIDMDATVSDEVAAILGLSKGNTNGQIVNAGPINMAMFSDMKVRIAIHFWNLDNVLDYYRSFFIKKVSLAALVDDTVAPEGNLVKIDSVGNTFMRGYFDANELCNVYWAAIPKGETISSLQELVENVGTSAYKSSGSFPFNVPGIEKSFFIDGLDLDTEYTIVYGAVDYKGNKSDLKTMDQKTTIDLTAPVVTKLESFDVTETTVSFNLQADELGIISYRVYNVGLEPQDFDQFMAGTGAVRRGGLSFDTLAVDEDWIVEDLELNKVYIAYAVVTDMTGNVSDIFMSESFTTLNDSKAPIILTLEAGTIGNHDGTVLLTADEPTAGFGGATCYWSATSSNVELTSAEVLSRVSARASGSATLDSATYINNIELMNLDQNTEYKIHVVVVDGNENVSEVSTLTITTADNLEKLPAMMQDFNVEDQNYHFVQTVDLEGYQNWSSLPTGTHNNHLGDVGYVQAKVAFPRESGYFQESWCMVGPIDLTGMSEIAVSSMFSQWYKNYGGMSVWISKKYDPDTKVVDLNDWYQISGIDDLNTKNKTVFEKEWVVDEELDMDTAGVFVGFYFKHDAFSHNYRILDCNVSGIPSGNQASPIIDWVEAGGLSATTGKLTFNASTFGRLFYYVVKDDGTGVTAPDMATAISGEGADVFGYFDYAAGNFVDESFTMRGLEPNSKYHVYTTFRNFGYVWSDEVFYDAASTVFETSNLEILLCDAESVFATSVDMTSAAVSTGKFVYTVKPQGAEPALTYEDVINSFDRRGSQGYQLVDGDTLGWSIGNLVPGTSYDIYVALADGSEMFGSDVKKVEITTPNIEVLSAVGTDPVQVNDTTMLYNVDFTVATSAAGKLYMLITEKDATQPTIESVIAGEGGVYATSTDILTPDSIYIQASDLTPEISENYEAWYVVVSGKYASKLFAIGRSLEYTYNIQIKVTDENGKPLPGLNVKVGSADATTNVSGKVDFDDVAGGSISYEVVKGNYVEVGTLDVDADGSFVIVVIEKFDATIVVKDDQGAALSGVSVVIADQTIETGSNGEALFAGLRSGVYNYTATRNGKIVEGTIDITAENATANVVYGIYDATVVVKDLEGNLLAGVSVTIGDVTSVTDESGIVVFENLDAAVYDVVASRNDVEMSATVNLESGDASIDIVYDLTGIYNYERTSIKVYPNPTSSQVNVLLTSRSSLSISDVSGRVVLRNQFDAGLVTINVEHLERGSYFVQVKGDSDNVSISKLMIE